MSDLPRRGYAVRAPGPFGGRTFYQWYETLPWWQAMLPVAFLVFLVLGGWLIA